MIDRYARIKMKALWSEDTKYEYWAKVERAHLESLTELDDCNPQVLKAFDRALKKKSAADFLEREKETHHDVIAFVAEIGDAMGSWGSFLHKGLTSSDVVDTAMVLRVRAAWDQLLPTLHKIHSELAKQAEAYKETICMGRTHGIHAEPMSFGQVILSYLAECDRVLDKAMKSRTDFSFGKVSGAVGTYSQLAPEYEKLILNKLELEPELVSTQIIPRDRFVDVAQALLSIALLIERFATNMRHWARTELLEVTEPFGQRQKGSSAMPHKKNPILCENLCGLARTAKGYFFMILENTPLWHERDISHSSCERIAFPDLFQVVDFMMHRFLKLVTDMDVNQLAMMKNIRKTQGLWASQSVLTHCVHAGMNRTQAYEAIQSIALEVLQKIQREDVQGSEPLFLTKCLEHPKMKKYFSQEELRTLFQETKFLKHVDAIYQRTFESLKCHSPETTS